VNFFNQGGDSYKCISALTTISFKHIYISTVNFIYSLCLRYSTIETREAASNTDNFFCLNNNVSNLYNYSVVEKTNGMTFNPTTTLKLIY
jgi:hypothetical protein